MVTNIIKCYDENKQDIEKMYSQRKARTGTTLEECSGAHHEKARSKDL